MKTLPNTTLTVSPICLGTSDLGTTVPEANAFTLLDTYIDRGGNFLDTAAVYANWIPGERNVSEKTLGRWMKTRGNRDKLVVATKGAHPDLTTMHISRMSPQEIVSDLDDSLRNLQVDHRPVLPAPRRSHAPGGQTMETLNANTCGKIRYRLLHAERRTALPTPQNMVWQDSWPIRCVESGRGRSRRSGQAW